MPRALSGGASSSTRRSTAAGSSSRDRGQSLVTRVDGPRSNRGPLRAQVRLAALEQSRQPGAQEDQLALHDGRCPTRLPISPGHFVWVEGLVRTIERASRRRVRSLRFTSRNVSGYLPDQRGIGDVAVPCIAACDVVGTRVGATCRKTRRAITRRFGGRRH